MEPPSVLQIAEIRLSLRPYLQLVTGLILLLGVLGGWTGQSWPFVLATVVVVVISNIWIGRLARRGGLLPIYISAVINLAASGLIVMLTGGAGSPFWLLFLVGALTSAMSLRDRAGYYLDGLNIAVATIAMLGPELAPSLLNRLVLTHIGMRVLTLVFVGVIVRKATLLLLESKRFNQRITDATPHIIYLFDIIEQRNIYANRRMTDLLGYTPQAIQALGSDFMPTLLHPDDLVRLEALFQRWDTAADGDVIETEYRMKHADGTWRWFIGSDTVFTRTGGGRVKQIIGIAQDITERKQAEAVLREESSFRSAIVEGAAEGICVCHEIAEFPYVAFTVWNERMVEITGYSLEEINRLGWYQRVYPDPEVQARAIARMARMRQGDDLRSEEWTITRADGTKRVLLISSSVLPMGAGPVHTLALMHDVTERKQAEAALQESEQRFAVLSAATFEGIVISDRGRIIDVNEQLAAMLGYERSEMVGLTIEKFVAPESLELVLQHIQSGSEEPYEHLSLRKDGSRFPVEIRARSLSYKGRILRMTAIRDMTERQQAEEKLRESEQYYRMLTESLTDFVVHLDREGRIQYINHLAEGYTIDRVLGKHVIEFLAPEFHELAYQALKTVLETGQAVTLENFGQRTATTQGWFFTRLVPINTGSDDSSVLLIATDITERKQAEETLHQAEVKYRTLVEHLPAIAFTVEYGEVERTTYISPQVETLLGFSQAEWLADPEMWFRQMHPADRDRILAGIRDRDTSGELLEVEYRVLARNGEVLWFHNRSKAIRDAAGRPRFVHGVMFDITAYKQTQEALRFQKVLLECQSEASPDGILIVSNERQWLSYNRRFLEIWRYSQPVIEGRSNHIALQEELPQLLEPEQFLATTEYFYAHLDESGRDELRFTDGRVIERHTSPVNDEHGAHYGRVWYYRDITAHKQAEEALRESEERLRLFIEHAPASLAMFDREMRYLAFSRRWMADYHLEGRGIIGQSHYDIFPEIPDRWKAVHRRGLAGEVVQADEDPFVRLDGAVQWLRWEVRPWYTVNGAIGGIVIFTEDITGRKQAEKTILEREERLRSIFDNVVDGLITIDERGIIETFNPAAERIFGYAAVEIRGQNIGLLMPEPYRSHHDDYLAHYLRTGQAKVIGLGREVEGRRHDGSTFPLDLAVGEFHIGERSMFIGVVRDITQRKQAEEVLRQHEMELRRRNRELLLLNQVIVAAAAARESEAVLATACRELALTFELPQVVAALYNAEKTTAEVVAEYKSGEQASDLTLVVPVAENPASHYLFRHKAPLVIDDAQHDPYLAPFHDLMRQRGVVSLFILPLIINDEVMGSLNLTATEPRSFSTEEINLAWRVADQVALALARAQLDRERRQLSAAIEQAAESVVITNTAGDILYVNPTFERITGYSRAEVLGRNPRILKSGQQDVAFYEQMWATLTAGQSWQGRLVNKKKDGTLYTEEATISPVLDEKGAIVNHVGLKRDVTRELHLEEQLRQAQKMEAVGRLAGGVAHDFNNILTVLMGNAGLALEALSPDHSAYGDIQAVQKSAKRAADLTRQLLTFARKQRIHPQILDLNELVLNLDKMLRRLIREDIELVALLEPSLGRIKADPGQLEQVLINLVVNARDAMPKGGKLTLETTTITLKQDNVRQYPDLIPGEYVLLAVTDTGIGITEAVKAHLFEPFFTTKEVGQGTGLGLATCFGIVKQNGGHIQVVSEPGQGATFRIYLPRIEDALNRSSKRDEPGYVPRGVETILLVEDEPTVRTLAAQVLRQQGYIVLEATDGEEGLRLAQEQRGQEIHLLLTDLVMPRLGGQALAERLKKARPGLKVLYISGYADHSIGMLGTAFLPKPFSPEALAHKVREVLEAAANE